MHLVGELIFRNKFLNLNTLNHYFSNYELTSEIKGTSNDYIGLLIRFYIFLNKPGPGRTKLKEEIGILKCLQISV